MPTYRVRSLSSYSSWRGAGTGQKERELRTEKRQRKEERDNTAREHRAEQLRNNRLIVLGKGELQKEKGDHRNELQKVKDDHRNELQKVKDDHQGQVKTWAQQLDEETRARRTSESTLACRNSELMECKRKLDQKLNEYNAHLEQQRKHRATIADKEAELKKKQTKIDGLVEKLQTVNSECETLKEDTATMQKLRQDLEAATKQAVDKEAELKKKETLNGALVEKLQTVNSECEMLKADTAATMQKLRQDLEAATKQAVEEPPKQAPARPPTAPQQQSRSWRKDLDIGSTCALQRNDTLYRAIVVQTSSGNDKLMLYYVDEENFPKELVKRTSTRIKKPEYIQAEDTQNAAISATYRLGAKVYYKADEHGHSVCRHPRDTFVDVDKCVWMHATVTQVFAPTYIGCTRHDTIEVTFSRRKIKALRVNPAIHQQCGFLRLADPPRQSASSPAAGTVVTQIDTPPTTSAELNGNGGAVEEVMEEDVVSDRGRTPKLDGSSDDHEEDKAAPMSQKLDTDSAGTMSSDREQACGHGDDEEDQERSHSAQAEARCDAALVISHNAADAAARPQEENKEEKGATVTTSREQACSQPDISNRTSKYTGVCWHIRNLRWQAAGRFNGERQWLGAFEDEVEAAKAWDAAARKAGRLDLNFPATSHTDPIDALPTNVADEEQDQEQQEEEEDEHELDTKASYTDDSDDDGSDDDGDDEEDQERSQPQAEARCDAALVISHNAADAAARPEEENKEEKGATVTTSRKQASSQSHFSKCSSKYTGVSWNVHKHKWQVHLVRKWVGTFDDEVEAAKAWDAAARKAGRLDLNFLAASHTDPIDALPTNDADEEQDQEQQEEEDGSCMGACERWQHTNSTADIGAQVLCFEGADGLAAKKNVWYKSTVIDHHATRGYMLQYNDPHCQMNGEKWFPLHGDLGTERYVCVGLPGSSAQLKRQRSEVLLAEQPGANKVRATTTEEAPAAYATGPAPALTSTAAAASPPPPPIPSAMSPGVAGTATGRPPIAAAGTGSTLQAPASWPVADAADWLATSNLTIPKRNLQNVTRFRKVLVQKLQQLQADGAMENPSITLRLGYNDWKVLATACREASLVSCASKSLCPTDDLVSVSAFTRVYRQGTPKAFKVTSLINKLRAGLGLPAASAKAAGLASASSVRKQKRKKIMVNEVDSIAAGRVERMGDVFKFKRQREDGRSTRS